MIATQTPTAEQLIRRHGERWEFVRGEPLEKPLPGRKHSQCQAALVAALHAYARSTNSGAPFPEWHHRFGPPDDVRLYIPDLVFLLAPRHLDPPEYADAASDIMIEIVSPNDSAPDLVEKVQFYLRHGAKSVWIADPQKKRIDIYKPDRNNVRLRRNDVLNDELLPGFELPLKELFAA